MDIVERLRLIANGCTSYLKSKQGDLGTCDDAADEIERLRETIANAAKLNARLMDTIDLAKRMKTAAFNHWCEKTPETNGILVDLQFDFEDALEGLKKDGYFSFRHSTKGQ